MTLETAAGACEAAEVEAIERATIAAVAPQGLAEHGDWLLPYDAGSIGRAKSAVPLRHDRCDALAPGEIESHYRARGLTAAFRIADVPRLEPVREALRRRGYRPEQPTLVMVGACASMQAVSSGAPADVSGAADDAWAAVFLGPGFDPAEGASRVSALRRSPDAQFASVREAGKTLAVGVVAFGYGWASVHGMRTAIDHRGKGYAARILASLAQAALRRGLSRVFLQVEEGNAPARALYLRAGFAPAWRYTYWRSQPGGLNAASTSIR